MTDEEIKDLQKECKSEGMTGDETDDFIKEIIRLSACPLFDVKHCRPGDCAVCDGWM